MATIVLVHGAWHDSGCWQLLQPILESAGHTVLAPDLPGHGARRNEMWRATLGGYARAVRNSVADTAGPVVLVGHSMGGAVITQVAARYPRYVSGLIYLCAFAPLGGESLVSLARADKAGGVPSSVEPGLWSTRFKPERAAAVFYNQCSAALAQQASATLQLQPNLPTLQRVSPSPALCRRRAYLLCRRDEAISPDHQAWMAERAGIADRIERDWDHSPFLSAPEELARDLADILARWGMA